MKNSNMNIPKVDGVQAGGDVDGAVAAAAEVVLFRHVVWLGVEESGDGGLIGAEEGRVRRERHC